MATYYRPPPQRVSVNTAQQSGESLLTHTYDQPSQEVQDQSIYIFPVPSTIPSSPGGSSAFSVPSDISENLTISSVGRSRHSSISSQFTDRSRSHDSSATRLSYVDEDEEAVFSPIVDIRFDPEVEVWEWSETEAGDDPPVAEGSWSFAAGESTDTLSGIHGSITRRPSLSRPRAMSRRDSRAVHPRPTYMRSRTQSNISTHSSHASRYTPHPRVRVPLLSLVASFFSLDLDDPALRLLTHSTPDSILFPGQPGLLHDTSGPSTPLQSADASDDDTASSASSEEDEPHGVLRLLTSGEPGVKSVREGLASICESPLASPLALPGWTSWTSICRLVGDVWTHGGQAWREFGGSDDTQGAS